MPIPTLTTARATLARSWREAERISNALDCLLVIGTSATVYPAAGLIETALSCGSHVICVNTEPTELVGAKHPALVGSAAAVVPALLEGLLLATRAT